jgi:hypothetical protein
MEQKKKVDSQSGTISPRTTGVKRRKFGKKFHHFLPCKTMNMKVTKIKHYVDFVKLSTATLFRKIVMTKECKGTVPREMRRCKGQENIHL